MCYKILCELKDVSNQVQVVEAQMSESLIFINSLIQNKKRYRIYDNFFEELYK